jgi:hypothetical protein
LTAVAARSVSVYLDTNKWIDLAKARLGRPDGERFKDALRALSGAVRSGIVVVPFSSEHVIELSAISNERQRLDVVEVLLDLSEGVSIADMGALLPREAARSVSRFWGEIYLGPDPEPFGRGVQFAFGVDENDIADLLKISLPRAQLLHGLTSGTSALRGLLLGDSHAEITRRLTVHRATWADGRNQSRGRRGKVAPEMLVRIHAAELTDNIQDTLVICCRACGKSLGRLFASDGERVLDLILSIPTAEAMIRLGAEAERQRDRQLAPNDLTDLGFLSPAIVYCDILVMERFWADMVRRTGLDVKHGTSVITDLAELPLELQTRGILNLASEP